MKNFDLIEMASGGLALVLEYPAVWDDFLHLSVKWAGKLKGKIVGEPIISVDECLLEVNIRGGSFWISYDDWQSALHLEPKSKEYNTIILELRKELQNK